MAGKYIQYERIQQFATKKQVEEIFIKIVERGQEIIYYDEDIMDNDSIRIVIIVGLPNEGNKLLLND